MAEETDKITSHHHRGLTADPVNSPFGCVPCKLLVNSNMLKMIRTVLADDTLEVKCCDHHHFNFQSLGFHDSNRVDPGELILSRV